MWGWFLYVSIQAMVMLDGADADGLNPRSSPGHGASAALRATFLSVLTGAWANHEKMLS